MLYCVVPLSRRKVAVFPRGPLRRCRLTYISKQTGRDGGGVYSDGTDFRTST